MSKVEKVMGEYKRGKLHSGSKEGPKVKSKKQAVAIGLSEARKAGEKVSPEKRAEENKYLNKAAEQLQRVIKDDTKAMKSAPEANNKYLTRMKLRGC